MAGLRGSICDDGGIGRRTGVLRLSVGLVVRPGRTAMQRVGLLIW